jgi:hypothetical protein
MTQKEREILSPIVRRLWTDDPSTWSDLKYQTQYGPEFPNFPYYPAAVEFQDEAQRAIKNLTQADKNTLVAEWRAGFRHPYNFTDEDRILKQYGVIVIDQLVNRAKQAGARTAEF